MQPCSGIAQPSFGGSRRRATVSSGLSARGPEYEAAPSTKLLPVRSKNEASTIMHNSSQKWRRAQRFSPVKSPRRTDTLSSLCSWAGLGLQGISSSLVLEGAVIAALAVSVKGKDGVVQRFQVGLSVGCNESSQLGGVVISELCVRRLLLDLVVGTKD